MSERDERIDGYPTREEKKLRKLENSGIIRRVAFKAIDYFVEGNGNSIVTWVDTEQSWDGHAVALQRTPDQRISMMYLHVNRDKKRLIQQSQLEFEVAIEDAAEVDVKEDQEETEALLEEGGLEFDRSDLVYTYAMLAKAACLGSTRLGQNADKSVMHILYEENLDELREMFPQRVEEQLPYTSEKFLRAVKDMVRVEQLQEDKREVHLRRSFGDELYVIHLQLEDGKPIYGIFVRGEHENWISDFHRYEEDEPTGLEAEWDESKLVRTIRTGLPIGQKAFEAYLDEAKKAEIEDIQARRVPPRIKPSTSEDLER